MTLRSVAVFCGSSPGRLPVYREQAEATGRLLAERGIDVVYGGGRAGLMGVVADSALAAGGRVVGVIPRALHERELTHTGVTELHVVETMHERKAIMADRSDAFVALPGGAGTLEEIAEQWTWAQLGIHAKPCGFLDVGGFWDPVRVLLERMVGDGFVREHQRGIVTFDHDLARLLDVLAETPAWAGSDKVAPEDVPPP